MEFFGVLLYLKNQLDYQVQEVDLYELMIENYLNQGKINEEKLYHSQQSPSHHAKKNVSQYSSYTNKFEELWAFVKSIENYIRIPQDPNTKNYLSIDNFKYNYDAEEIFVKYTIDWINRKYTEIDAK